MWPLSYITTSMKSTEQRAPPCLHHTAPHQLHFLYISAATFFYATLRLQNPPRRATLSWHSRTRVSQRHTTADFAPCSPYEFRSPSRTAIPPASTSCAFCFDFDFTCGRLCADPTAPTQFDSGAGFVARVPATNPAVLTADTDPINSRASGAGQLACFGLPLRERPCLGGKCQQARGCSWAFATMLGSS